MTAGRRKGWGLGPFLPLRVSTPPLWGRIHYLRICSVLRSESAEERVEKQMSSQTRSALSSPPPPDSDFQSPSLSSPRPSPLAARPLSYLLLRRWSRSSGTLNGSRGWERTCSPGLVSAGAAARASPGAPSSARPPGARALPATFSAFDLLPRHVAPETRLDFGSGSIGTRIVQRDV